MRTNTSIKRQTEETKEEQIAKAYAEYEKTREQAQIEYEKICAPARIKYQKILKQAWTKYQNGISRKIGKQSGT